MGHEAANFGGNFCGVTEGETALGNEEWLLRRIHPKQAKLVSKHDGGERPQSSTFSASGGNGGISFDRYLTRSRTSGSLIDIGKDMGVEQGGGLAAIKVKDILGCGLTIEQTPPPPHHYEAFGVANLPTGNRVRVLKCLAKASMIAIWPDGAGGQPNWPPTDRHPPRSNGRR